VDSRNILWLWLFISGLWTFALFGFDKARAHRGGSRIAESTLAWSAALGGWPGGLLGMLIFRHKTVKGTFLLKFAAAFVLWAALLFAAWRL
jgi:uncharacterized membrane protein YsdA (DUF1294 family)